MYPPAGLTEAIDYVLLEFEQFRPLIPTYTHLLLSTLFALYIGSHASLSRPSSAKKPVKKNLTEGGEDDNEDEDEDDDEEGHSVLQKMEGLEPSDAIIFPIMSGLTLGGLYLLIKHFDITYLNKILNWYFSHASFIFAVTFTRDGLSVLRSFIFPSRYSFRGVLWKVNQRKHLYEAVTLEGSTLEPPQIRKSPLPGLLGSFCLPNSVLAYIWRVRGVSYQKASLRAYVRSVVDLKTRFTILDVFGIIFALVVVVYSVLFSRPWWLINFLGFCFSYGALQFLSPTTFWTGSLILGSLFFYDIYFVFYTPLMVTVAQKLDLPIKLLFPRPPGPKDDPSIASLAMLGLGDIVVPGTMIGLALRFDLYLHYLRNGKHQTDVDSCEDGRVPYTTATGGWGERFWTGTLSTLKLPEKEITYNKAKSFRKPYFTAGVVGYVLGIIATLLSMQLSKHPQPALLFLVPGVLLSIWLTGYAKGDIHTMWNFSDDVGEDDTTKDGSDKTAPKTADAVPAPSGLLSKLFGSKKASLSADGSPTSESDESGNEKKNNSSEKLNDEKSKGADTTKKKDHEGPKESNFSNELISFSISVAERPERNRALKGDIQSDFQLSQSSNSSSPVLVEREGQPPLKKRKGNSKAQ